MNIPKDKQLHLIGTAIAAALVIPLVWIAQTVGLPLAVLAGGTAVAIGYELLQKYLGTGEPSWEDATAGVAGSTAVALVVAFLPPF